MSRYDNRATNRAVALRYEGEGAPVVVASGPECGSGAPPSSGVTPIPRWPGECLCLESPPNSEVLQIRILGGKEEAVAAHREIQLIGMDDSTPNRVGVIIRQRDDKMVIHQNSKNIHKFPQ